MKVVPLKDFVVVKKLQFQDKKAGIIMPESRREAAEPESDDIFEVLAKGPDKDVDVKVGDKVAIVGYLQHIKYKGEKATLARARDVICVVKD
jgi:co-chaperonin GroES (HSP10)